MTVIIVAELKNWRAKGAVSSIAILVGCIGVVWLFSGAQLLFCLVAALGFVGWLAWQCAFDVWFTTKSINWHLHFAKSFRTIILAKLTVFISLALLHLLLLLPLFIQDMRLWGMPASSAWLALAIILIGGVGFFLVCAFQINSSLSWRGGLVAVAACSWLIPSLALTPLQPANPILLLVGLFTQATGAQTGLGLAVLGLIAVAALLLNLTLLNRRHPELKHEH